MEISTGHCDCDCKSHWGKHKNSLVSYFLPVKPKLTEPVKVEDVITVGLVQLLYYVSSVNLDGNKSYNL